MAAHTESRHAQLPAHLALRIALAARELKGIETAQLLRALLAITGEPITESRLARLRLNRLRNQLAEVTGVCDPSAVVSERQLQRAVSLLKGRGVEMPKEPLPEVQPYREGELVDSVRIACASNNGERLDGSFSSCERFLIYQISPVASRLIAIREPEPCSEDEDRNAQRAELLQDCQLLYTLSIGGPATSKVIRAGVHPIKIGNNPQPAREIVSDLQRVLASSPPPWLAKAMGADPVERARFSTVAAEDPS